MSGSSSSIPSLLLFAYNSFTPERGTGDIACISGVSYVMALGEPTVWKAWIWLRSEVDRILQRYARTEGANDVECLVG